VKSSRPGVTLLELIIVMALMSLIIATGAQFLSMYDRTLAHHELEHMYSLSMYLQRRAVIEHRTLELVFNQENNSYSWLDSSHQFARPVTYGILDAVKGPPSHPEKIVLNPISFIHRKLVFFPDGSISAGTIYVIDTHKSCLYALTCGISQVALLRQYRYDNGTWHALLS
jgi:prepilin-type N-terminal cleavage/methylation domain-containing protein